MIVTVSCPSTAARAWAPGLSCVEARTGHLQHSAGHRDVEARSGERIDQPLDHLGRKGLPGEVGTHPLQVGRRGSGSGQRRCHDRLDASARRITDESK